MNPKAGHFRSFLDLYKASSGQIVFSKTLFFLRTVNISHFPLIDARLNSCFLSIMFFDLRFEYALPTPTRN